MGLFDKRRGFESLTFRCYAPMVKWTITARFEREVPGSNPGRGTHRKLLTLGLDGQAAGCNPALNRFDSDRRLLHHRPSLLRMRNHLESGQEVAHCHLPSIDRWVGRLPSCSPTESHVSSSARQGNGKRGKRKSPSVPVALRGSVSGCLPKGVEREGSRSTAPAKSCRRARP